MTVAGLSCFSVNWRLKFRIQQPTSGKEPEGAVNWETEKELMKFPGYILMWCFKVCCCVTAYFYPDTYTNIDVHYMLMFGHGHVCTPPNPLTDDDMESSAVHRSSRATKRFCVCCQVDSPCKYLWSRPNALAPSVPICPTTGGFG